MNDQQIIDRIIRRGRALVRAVDALGTIQPIGLFECALTRLLVAAYKRRFRGIVKVRPSE
jgi:hypothetical protein